MSIRVIGIPGSLREGSFNKILLRAAIELAPTGMEITTFKRLGDIAPYNDDVMAKGDPEPVAAFKTAIREADAMLIATPEYNYGVPGVLKNAIDWASRPTESLPPSWAAPRGWAEPFARNTRCASLLSLPRLTSCFSRKLKFPRWQKYLTRRED